MTWRLPALLASSVLGGCSLAATVSIVPMRPAQVGQLCEFRVDGLPTVSNPFDPELVRVDADFTAPGGKILNVPGFWYQSYSRLLSADTESLQAIGAPEWRVRFTPGAPGDHLVTVSVVLSNQPLGSPVRLSFAVGTNASAGSGVIRVAANQRYLASENGQALPLIGHCVCWHGRRGTYDYDAWFSAMHNAGENSARLWMCPWAFGIESPADLLNRYRLDRAWQLDYVFQLAEQKGIYLLLCLDYHGMFETQPDYWGGNNYWPQNPYNAAQGGPCVNQDAFFTNTVAKAVYQKRLRYLVARYAYSPSLLAWEFFNEIDNVYQYLNPTNVAAWHATMGDWLKAHDPYHHLVTTSLTGGSDRADLWRLPQMDFAMYHSYNLPDPALGLSSLAQSFLGRYQKPLLIGEYGVDWRGWNKTNDVYLRGLRQGIWAGLLGGSVGTSMSWYWEALHQENVYPLYSAISNFVARTRLGQGQWQPVSFKQAPPPPTAVGPLLSNGTPFTVRLDLNTQWGAMLPGLLAVPNPESGLESQGALNGFVHGTGHPELRIPFKVSLWCGTNASLVLHLNSVSDGAVINIRVDGASLFTKSVPNKDGAWQVNNEYNTNFTNNLPAGKHTVEIRNTGGDWFYLYWVQFEDVLPAAYDGNWQPLPIAIGLRGEGETLIYAANPRLKYPAKVSAQTLDPVVGASVTLSNWPAGSYRGLWYDALAGAKVGETGGATSGGQLELPLPEFREDLAGRLIREHSLSISNAGENVLEIRVAGDSGLDYRVESSTNLFEWSPAGVMSHAGETIAWQTPADAPRQFYRTWTP